MTVSRHCYTEALNEFIASNLPYAKLKRVELRNVENVVTCINATARVHELPIRAMRRGDTIFLRRIQP